MWLRDNLEKSSVVMHYSISMFKSSRLSKLLSKAGKRLALLVKGNRTGVGLFYFDNPKTIVCANVKEACSHLGWNGEEIDAYIESGYQKFSEVIAETKRDFPENWNSEVNLSIMLYVAIRSTNAQVVVETGVANGVSTNMIMAGLEFTDGTLYSFDVDERCSKAYSGNGNWNFNLLSPNNPEISLAKASNKFSEIDLWLHDSDHSNWWQSFEYEFALTKLRRGGYLFSDDIDFSTAWVDFAPVNFSRNIVLFDFRKLIGIAQNYVG